jgi:multidrug efflux pump subunit AcrA (membrane-fusion protein)
MSEYEISSGNQSNSRHNLILYVLIALLAGAVGYLFYQNNQTHADIAQSRDQLLDEMSKIRETSAVSTQTSRRTAEQLKTELDAARAQSSQLVGQARADADKRAEQLSAALQRAQAEQTQRVAQVSQEVSQVKDQTTAASNKITEVSSDVGQVKTDLSSTKADLEKTIAQLKSTQGDLGLQSGLIATNGKELQALRALGERNYVEFKLAKTKAPQKVGDISILLKKADMKSNRYTVEVIADDKRVEKKDKTLNEPVQFMLSRAAQPYELVVNDVKKDMISGYVSSPKVQEKRGSSN